LKTLFYNNSKTIKLWYKLMIIKKFFVFGLCLFVLSGCVYNDEPMPTIVQTNKIVEPKVFKHIKAEPRWIGYDKNVPSNWFPPEGVEKGWKAIVIHHSAQSRGNAAIFDEWHRNGRHWKGVGYDFVIGNGSNSGNGQVEVTFRWREQIAGAHVGGTPNNWANEDAIGICLVGNFQNSPPTSRQMQSLVKLVGFLQKRYNIPMNKIYGHRDTPGYTGGSLCPGRYFPMAEFKSMLGY